MPQPTENLITQYCGARMLSAKVRRRLLKRIYKRSYRGDAMALEFLAARKAMSAPPATPSLPEPFKLRLPAKEVS